MNSSIYRFTLDMHSAQSQISIPVMRGDTSRTFRITLSDGGSQYIITDGCLAKITIKRPTGTHLEEFCTIEDNTTIVYPFSQNENTAAVEGIHDCDVTLYGFDGEKLGTARFSMVVSEKVLNSDDIVVTDEDSTAIDAILKAEASRQLMESQREEAETGRSEAETERVKAEEERIKAGEVALQAVEDAKTEANRAKAEADKAKTASDSAAQSAAESATQAAEDEVARLVAEIGIEQTKGDRVSATMSQKVITDNFNRVEKRVTNLEQGIVPDPFETDDSVAYHKTPCEYALPYAEVTKIGGMTHRDTATNTLKEANVTAVRSIGVNMANIQDRTETVKNSYYIDTPLGIRLDLNSKYTISMDYEVVSTDATALSLGVGYGENAFQAGIFDKSYPNLTSGTLVVTITTPTKWLHSNKAWVRLVRGSAPHNSTVKISNFMFVKGTVLPSSFVPYEESILSVPSDVQALDGYGRGVNGVYNNHIDLVGKSFNRVVSRKVFDGTETFSFYTNSLGKPYACVMWAGLSGRLEATPCVVSPPFEYTGDSTVINGTTAGYKVWAHNLAIYGHYHYITIPVADLGLTTEATAEEIKAAFKVWLADMYAKGTPYTVEWVLKEPVVTDISEILLSDDNFIGVFEGGTVIAENENALAAPTTITYQFPIERAVGYEDGDEVSY